MENTFTCIVKFKGTGRSIRILYNQYVSGRLGESIGVPFGEHALIDVPDVLHPPRGTPNIKARMPGVQFFATYYDGQTDLAQLKRASNFLSHFPALLVFDTYILRQDSRQYVVYSGPNAQNGDRDTAAIFDQGFTFTGSPDWTTQSLQQSNVRQANNGLGLRGDLGAIANYEPFIQIVEGFTLAQLQLKSFPSPEEDHYRADEATRWSNLVKVGEAQQARGHPAVCRNLVGSPRFVGSPWASTV